MKTKIELLAPAGSMETMKAAVQAGADAVYLAGARFGARQSAENFTHEALKEAIDYCHIRGVKVYAAVNTLIKTREMSAVLEEIGILYHLQTDALIVQDWGLADLVRKHYPDLELHGSTQMSIYDAAGVKKALEAGVTRVVIARETHVETIRSLVAETGAEIEAFVHGALCYSYSGQCLMSSQIGGRSGNRGRCAQPCRKKYNLRQGSEGAGKLIKEGYPLSTRDLMTLDQLEHLAKCGIKSLKIEGRLRKSDYVSAVVAAYRSELDRIQGVQSSTAEGVPDIKGVFNRETTYGRILDAKPVEVLSVKGPGNMGQLIGKTAGYDRSKKQLMILLSESLRTGDGIKVIAGKEEPGTQVNGLFINREKVQKATVGQKVSVPFDTFVPEGCEVRRTLDLDAGKAATQFSLSNQKKIPLIGRVALRVGAVAGIWFTDPEGRTVSMESEHILEPAQNQGADEARIAEQIKKTGDTPYSITALEMDIDPQVFIPVKVLNNLRRDALLKLDALRINPYKRPISKIISLEELPHVTVRAEKPGIAVTIGNMEQLKSLKGLTLQRVDYTDMHTFKEAADLAESLKLQLCPAFSALVGLHQPQWPMDVLKEAGWKGPVRIGNLGQLELAQGGYSLIGDHTLSITNPWSADHYQRAGVSSLCLSPELSRDELLELARYAQTELLAYGRIVVMTSLLCPVQCGGPCLERTGQRFTLEDEKAFVFPARCRDGLFEVMNSRILNLIDAVGGLPQKSFARLRLDFDTERPEMVRRITQGFLSVVAGYARPKDTDAAFKSELHTAGAFKNGIE